MGKPADPNAGGPPGPRGGRTRLARRLALALGLMVGFYGLALGLALGLLRFAWLGLQRPEDVPLGLVLGASLFAGLILWTIRPHRLSVPQRRTH